MAANQNNPMKLWVWPLPDDYFNYQQLAVNFSKIATHDHTSDNGKQVPEDGIATDAITTTKIKDLNVTTAKIADANITSGKLGVGVQPTTLVTTSLPTTGLYDGYTVDYADSLTVPTYVWRLRYSSALSKWMYVGGSDYKSEKYPADPTDANNTIALSADTYTTLPNTSSATITAPLTGTYDIYHWGHISVASVSGHSSTNVYMNFIINSNAASANTPWVIYAPDANVGSGNIYSGSKVSRVSLSANNVLTCQFKTSTANTIRNYRHGITIKPVIIG